ncbi:MAG: hypothetical protein AB9919_01375 [Geobacteraceae bacterium]
MKALLIFVVALICYVLILPPFTTYLKQRPVVQKMGYLPEAKVLKFMVADHRNLVAEWAVLKVLFYYGGLMEGGNETQLFSVPPEYYSMFMTLQTALRLDPYNMDAYYFAQAAFTWDVGRVKEVNNMLDYGMRHRMWDYQLPFYAGFNAAYFLKDFAVAAEYMKKAAQLSGDPLFTNLAGRFFYESGREDLGIIFIKSMKKGARDRKVRRLLQMRIQALEAVHVIRTAVKSFTTQYGRLPETVDELVQKGLLACVPVDPYGGKFFVSSDGSVESTSKLALGLRARTWR